MAIFTYQGCELFYTEQGQGAPVLLAHGLGSSSEDWELQVPVLAEHYRVICLDLRGHGRSSKPRGPYSIAGMSADVLALLEHLQLAQVHYVGLSMGGMIGYQLAVDHPERLSSLCIINSSPEVKLHKAADYVQWFKRWALLRVMGMATLGVALGKNLFPRPEQADLRRKVAERWARNDPRAYRASFDAIVGWGVQERLSRIICPTLIISADHDYTPVALKEHHVTLIAGARLVVIKDSRHATPLDQPQRLNQTLLDFLATT
ncbi:alpha/beta hydrolase [Pseudomonas sp. dw_358]|uniref:alpha/beta fold hydrolase n=1 Tax=Pseudomonas sp. dw_358 TaxID=2720083 RepID=UPI001BD34B8C|nr:alpha/beta hydrolase [Pseudomonas sp. dw_358]